MTGKRASATAKRTEGGGAPAPVKATATAARGTGNNAAKTVSRQHGALLLQRLAASDPHPTRPVLHQGGAAQAALDGIGARGAALGRHLFISRTLGAARRDAVIAHEMTHVSQGWGRRFAGTDLRFGARTGALEREAGIAAALGSPVQPQRRSADPGVIRLYDQFELFTTSITPSWAAQLTDEELQQARTALDARKTEFPEGSAEHMSASDNDRVLADEITRRGTDSYQRDAESRAMSNRPQGPPCIFGIDNETRRIYASVAATGATLEEVSSFIYGTASYASRLAEENSLVPGQPLPPGITVRLVEGPLPHGAREVLNAGLQSGAIMRTQGIPAAVEDNGLVYTIPVGGRPSQVTGAQFNGVLQGIRRTTRIEIDRLSGLFQSLLETRTSHAKNTNRLVRGISDWAGDVDLPEPFTYTLEIGALLALRAQLDGLEFTGDPVANARQLQTVQRGVVQKAQRYERVEREWHAYIEGTIQGASRTVSRLETVRNISFAAVAGMAGAVAAPAAFAALGTVGVTGTTATGLSLGVAAGTGGVVRGTLEVASPGAQVQEYSDGTVVVSDDRRDAWTRFADTAPSGAVQGLMGGVGSFMSPAVSVGVNNQLVSRFGSAFLNTTRGQITSQVLTGAAVGLPTGAGGTALEAMPAYMRGDITGAQYLGAVGQGAGMGLVLGGAMAPLPINGLYRTGGVGFGTPVTPRWMLAGPASPLAPFSRHVPTGSGAGVSPEIPASFHGLAPEQLPAFTSDPAVAGYSWIRVRSGGVDQWAPVRTYGGRQEFQIGWHDAPNAGTAGNRVMMYGEAGTPASQMRLLGSRASQRPRGSANSYAGARDYPMETADYTYTSETGETVRYVRGHRIDHRDTADPTATIPNSTSDAANYSPEPLAWGSGRPGRGFEGRVQLTNRMGRENPGGGTQYGQYEYYGTSPRQTADGTPIPERVVFVEYGADGLPSRAWEINYTDPNVLGGVGMNRAAAIDAQYGVTDLSVVPVAREIPVQSLPPGVPAGAVSQELSVPERLQSGP